MARSDRSEALLQADGKLKWGLGLGVFAALSYALLGTVCPLCLIASPALIGAGLFGRARARRKDKRPNSAGSGHQSGGIVIQ